MDKKSGKAMQSYAKSVERMLASIAPWTKKDRREQRRKDLLRRGVQPGELVVILDSDEQSPFEGITVLGK